MQGRMVVRYMSEDPYLQYFLGMKEYSFKFTFWDEKMETVLTKASNLHFQLDFFGNNSNFASAHLKIFIQRGNKLIRINTMNAAGICDTFS